MTGERAQVRLQTSKFDGSTHWGADLVHLGSDEHGVWLGGGDGCVYERPGKRSESCAHVVLVPRDDWWVATFNAVPQGRSRTIMTYVDIATPAVVAEGEVFAVDLDLDVVGRVDGRVEIVDEDEFAAHQVEFGYPERVVEAAQQAALRIRDLMAAGHAPFDGSHHRYLDAIRS